MGCPPRLLRMKQSFNEGKKGTVQYDVYYLDTMTATHQRSYTCSATSCPWKQCSTRALGNVSQLCTTPSRVTKGVKNKNNRSIHTKALQSLPLERFLKSVYQYGKRTEYLLLRTVKLSWMDKISNNYVPCTPFSGNVDPVSGLDSWRKPKDILTEMLPLGKDKLDARLRDKHVCKRAL